MRTLITTAVAATALGLTACGGDDDTTRATAAPEAAPRAASAHPAGDNALARRCGLAPKTYRAIPRGAVPDGLVPQGGQIAVADRDQAVLHVPLAVPQALRALTDNARALGYTVDFSENENLEAELLVSAAGERLEMRLKAARSCSRASSVVVSRET